jgi:NAD(P)-dependent dehydrogenase (short-subunit alcohol dehydrogenase family)
MIANQIAKLIVSTTMTKHIIIGGTGGIGAAVARRLHSSGDSIHLIARDEGRLAALATEFNATYSVADVQDRGALETAILAAGPSVDGLCYAAGTINLKPVHRLTDADALRDFEINALGAFRAVQVALPLLKASTQATTSILLFSTVAVAQGFAAHASVSMAKGAIEGLTRALAAELSPKIRVNCLAPSLTRTPLATGLTSNEAMANSIALMHAAQRLGEPEDIAAMAALLLSPEAGWITGQVIGVDGGRSTLRTKG